jgi:hypothetical protein
MGALLSLALIIGVCLGVLAVVRSLWIGVLAQRPAMAITQTTSFALRQVAVPPGDRLILAVPASAWGQAVATPPAAGSAARTSRVGLRFGHRVVFLERGRLVQQIDGLHQLARGTLAITDRRVRLTGTRGTTEIALRDIAQFIVRGPLLDVRSRRASDPALVVTVPNPVAVATLLRALAVQTPT